MKKNMIWGLVLIIIGVLWGTNVIGLTNVSLFFDGWWTLFIIVPCIIGLINDKDKTGSIIGIILGILLLLGARDIINYGLVGRLIFPIVVVVIGISLLFKGSFDKEISKLNKNVKDNAYAIFSGKDLSFNKEEAKGSNLVSIFGGIKYDLRGSSLKKDIVINTYNFFGGVDILVDDNVKVKIKSTSFFGGVDDERSDKKDNSGNVIYINAVCFFGGVEVK